VGLFVGTLSAWYCVTGFSEHSLHHADPRREEGIFFCFEQPDSDPAGATMPKAALFGGIKIASRDARRRAALVTASTAGRKLDAKRRDKCSTSARGAA
jgi:hypothetical protein